MNYNKIYDQIIERSKNRSLEGYKEKHHIVPKCLGGGNEKSNIVELTAREHFLCHWLLHEMHPDNRKLMFAFWGMCNQMNRHQNRYIPSSRIYQYVKTIYSADRSLYCKKHFCGKNNPMFGKKHSKQTKDLISSQKKGKIGFKHKKESIAKIKNSKLGSLNPMSKKVNQYTLDNYFIKQWECITQAASTLNISRNGINRCCTKKYKSSGGFLWEYAN